MFIGVVVRRFKVIFDFGGVEVLHFLKVFERGVLESYFDIS